MNRNSNDMKIVIESKFSLHGWMEKNGRETRFWNYNIVR